MASPTSALEVMTMDSTRHMKASIWQRYLLPAVTFMSVVIGGGYATGRELVEFFMPAGPIGGLLGMLVAALVWSIVFALSLELARTTQSYEYRSFFKQLLGPAWVLFEISYLALLLLILAVLGAACGGIAADVLGAPEWIGAVLFILSIAALVWFGTAAIERFFSVWGVLLYAAYIAFFGLCLWNFSGSIATSLAAPASVPSASVWMIAGLAYAGYNIACAPALLFCARHQQQRRESLIAGALAGPVAMLPGMLFFIAMLARYPDIAQAPIPLQVLLRVLDLPWFAIFMQVVIFGTLVQTGIGVLHGFNERLVASRDGSAAGNTRALRLGVSLAISFVAIVLATRIGLVDLIAKGYGYISWLIIAVYVVPLLTVGVWRLWGRTAAPPAMREGI